MIICPECGEENPKGSKFCRKCGVNLVYDEPKVEVEEEPAKKVTVETNQAQLTKNLIQLQPIRIKKMMMTNGVGAVSVWSFYL